jgi:hypothetical protein
MEMLQRLDMSHYEENKFKNKEKMHEERNGILCALIYKMSGLYYTQLILKYNFFGTRARLSQSPLGQTKSFQGPRVLQACSTISGYGYNLITSRK